MLFTDIKDWCLLISFAVTFLCFSLKLQLNNVFMLLLFIMCYCLLFCYFSVYLNNYLVLMLGVKAFKLQCVSSYLCNVLYLHLRNVTAIGLLSVTK